MKYYVGHFKNKKGGRIFTTKKKVTAKTFPFYGSVHSFTSREDAEKHYTKKFGPLKKKKVASKKANPKTKKVARKTKLTIPQLKRKMKLAAIKLDRARSPKSKAKLKKCIKNCIRLLKLKELNKNPNKDYHVAAEKKARFMMDKFEEEGNGTLSSFYMGKTAAEEDSILEEMSMESNPKFFSKEYALEKLRNLKYDAQEAFEDGQVEVFNFLKGKIQRLMRELKRMSMKSNPLGATLMIAGNPCSRDREIKRLEHKLTRLKRKHSLRENPPQGTEIYSEILAIEAVKGSHGEFPNEKFRHDFKDGGKIIGLPNGDLLIKHKKGHKQWKNFDY